MKNNEQLCVFKCYTIIKPILNNSSYFFEKILMNKWINHSLNSQISFTSLAAKPELNKYL